MRNYIPLADVAVPGGFISGPFGSNLGSKDYVGSGVPVIRGANLDGDTVRGPFVYVTEQKVNKDLARSCVAPRDLVFTQRGTLGQVAIVPPEPHSCYVVSQSQMGLRVNPKVADERFVYYACRSTAFVRQVADNAIATGVPHINLGILRRLVIPEIDLCTQQAIADVLTSLDDKIAANNRMESAAFELANAMALSVMKLSVRSNKGPTHTSISELGQLFDGPHATPARRNEGPYFLNIASLKTGRLDLSESDHVSEEDFAKWTRRVTPQPEDLLFSYETRLGEAALMPDQIRACLGRRMALLRPNRTRVDPYFLLHFYLSAEFQRTITARTIHGATVPRIGLATMGEWEVDIPTLEEQSRIAPQLSALHDTVIEADRESGVLARTRDELLPLLLSGKVTVKTAEQIVGERI